MVSPTTSEELAEALAEASAKGELIRTGGAFSKDRFGGPATQAGVTLTTRALSRVLEYEPKDLTISVEAGMAWADLQRLLDQHGQAVPLDPPAAQRATVGGVVASNSSGPRRRLYGTARDMVIGLQFATLAGKLIQSGGRVVKNVAGLDMGKLMIGSFGTLTVITRVNFKLFPKPPVTRTFLFQYDSLALAIAKRDHILASVLQPAAIDLLNPPGSERIGRRGWILAVQAGGSERVIERYAREMPDAERLAESEEAAFWRGVAEFVPDFLEREPDGAVVRVSVTLREAGHAAAAAPGPLLARAGNGVLYCCFASLEEAADAARSWTSAGRPSVLECLPTRGCTSEQQWPRPGSALPVMEGIKAMLDPKMLLNRGRLYGRI